MVQPKACEPYVRALPIQRDAIAQDIGTIAKICRKLPAPTGDEIPSFVRKLAAWKHESAFEHRRMQVVLSRGSVINWFGFTEETERHIGEGDIWLRNHLAGMVNGRFGGRYLTVTQPYSYGDLIIEGNFHAWRDYFRDWLSTAYLNDHLTTDRSLVKHLKTAYSLQAEDLRLILIGRVLLQAVADSTELYPDFAWIFGDIFDQIPEFFSDSCLALGEASPTPTSEYATVVMQIPRLVADRIARHRMAQMMESTRGVRYKSGVPVISQSHYFGWTAIKNGWRGRLKRLIWWASMVATGLAYKALLKLKCPAQEAATVLTFSTATVLVTTGTKAEWTHFINLRTQPDVDPMLCSLAWEIKQVVEQQLGSAINI